jgi:hypothetical protein
LEGVVLGALPELGAARFGRPGGGAGKLRQEPAQRVKARYGVGELGAGTDGL